MFSMNNNGLFSTLAIITMVGINDALLSNRLLKNEDTEIKIQSISTTSSPVETTTGQATPPQASPDASQSLEPSIKSYETITFEIIKDNNNNDFNITTGSEDDDDDILYLLFSAFDNDYEFGLQLNKHMNPSLIKHGNNVNLNGYISGMNKSCHYQIINDRIRINNTLSLNSSYSTDSTINNTLIGGISICPNRGIHGRITTLDNEILIIEPLKHDDGLHRYYNIQDEHIIYKVSDVNRATAAPSRGEDSPVKTETPGVARNNNDNNKQTDHYEDTLATTMNSVQNKLIRRLLQSSGNDSDGIFNMEMYVLIDPPRYIKFYNKYGNDWYDELLAYTLTVINDASVIFENQNWNYYQLYEQNTQEASDSSNFVINELYLTLVELEVFTTYDGIYSVFDPTLDINKEKLISDDTPDCDNVYNTKCEFVISGYLQQFSQFMVDNKDFNTFDHGIFFTNMRFGNTYGMAWYKTVCDHNSGDSASIVAADWHDSDVFLVAHELGHHFGMLHAWDTECFNEDDLSNEGNILGRQRWNGVTNNQRWGQCDIRALYNEMRNNANRCMTNNIGASSDVRGVIDNSGIDNNCNENRNNGAMCLVSNYAWEEVSLTNEDDKLYFIQNNTKWMAIADDCFNNNIYYVNYDVYNGYWENNGPFVRNFIIDYTTQTEMYLFRNEDDTQWIISKELNNNNHKAAICDQENVFDCGVDFSNPDYLEQLENQWIFNEKPSSQDNSILMVSMGLTQRLTEC